MSPLRPWSGWTPELFITPHRPRTRETKGVTLITRQRALPLGFEIKAPMPTPIIGTTIPSPEPIPPRNMPRNTTVNSITISSTPPWKTSTTIPPTPPPEPRVTSSAGAKCVGTKGTIHRGVRSPPEIACAELNTTKHRSRAPLLFRHKPNKLCFLYYIN